MSLYHRIGSLLPKRVIGLVSEELGYTGLNIDAKRFAGFVFSFSLGLSLAFAFNFSVLFRLPLVETFLVLFVFMVAVTYYWLSSVAESKGSFVEKILPDALQLIASNIKSGITTERALFISARPEFGPLSVELKNASKRVLSGERLELVLSDIPKKIKSDILARTVWLITQGVKRGGKIAELLLQLGDDLRIENSLKEETKASISMYIIMILVSAAVAAPLLFSISSFIVQILASQIRSLPVTQEQLAELGSRSPVGGFIGAPKISIGPEFIVFYSLIVLLMTAIFSALTIGIIARGSEKGGIKYIPILLAVDFVLFFAARSFLMEVLGKTFAIG